MEEIKITYKQIQEANETIKTTDIKGKDYAEVNQRIKAFRMVNPNGSITTEIISIENGVATMKTKIINENGDVIGTGLAQEKENSTFINKTSFIENCETSAVGRALGVCGFGIDTSVASLEEVQNAIANQETKKTTSKEPVTQKLATESQIKIITEKFTEEELKILLPKVKKEKVEDLTIAEASSLIKLKEKK